MNIRFLIAALGVAGLVSCSGSDDKQLLVDAWVNEGEATLEQCTCLADQAEAQLDDELFGAMVELASSGGENQAEIFEDMSPEQGMALMGFALAVASECEISM